MLFWILLFVVIIGAFSVIIAGTFPKLLLKNSYSGLNLLDRGIKKCRLKSGGAAVVYEPEDKVRKYINKYVLSEIDGKKTLNCKIADDIRYIDSEITVYNNKNKAFISFSSKNIIEKPGEMKEIVLPDQCAYVSLSLNRVNTENFENERKIRIPASRVLAYFILSVIASFGFAMLTKLCFANIFAGIFREDFFKDMWETILIVIVTMLVGILASIMSFIAMLGRNRRKR